MRRLAVLLAACAVAACSDPEDVPPVDPPGGPRTASPLADGGPLPVTSFAQTVPDLCGASCGLGEVFPGQANTWVVDRDFSLARGWGAQFDLALALYVGTPTAVTHAALLDDVATLLEPFPHDQDASEVTFLTPLFGPADGVRTAAASNGVSIGLPAISGARSGYLNGTSDSRLSRTLALTAGATYTLTWQDEVSLDPGRLANATTGAHAPSYRVVLRAGAEATELLSATWGVSGPHEATFTAPAAEVELSFELRSAAGGVAAVDDVALAAADASPIALANGDFEGESLAPWQASAGAESQNVQSGARELATGGGTLTVTRTFYAPPSASWARVVDVFENPGAEPVTTHAVYLTTAYGMGRRAATRAGGAFVAWDADGFARDFAVVGGTGSPLVAGSDPFLFLAHELAVPAGGKVALTHFVVQLGSAEGGATAAEVPAATAAAIDAIVAGFPADAPFTLDLEPGVLDAIANF